jgi:hypothetical protein
LTPDLASIASLAILVGRAAAFVVALWLLYIAAFMYENEEGRLQNRLESAWIRLDDLRQKALSRHLSVTLAVTRHFNQLLDHLFGKRLLSTRALVVSAALSIASLFALEPVIRSLESFGIDTYEWSYDLFYGTRGVGAIGGDALVRVVAIGLLMCLAFLARTRRWAYYALAVVVGYVVVGSMYGALFFEYPDAVSDRCPDNDLQLAVYDRVSGLADWKMLGLVDVAGRLLAWPYVQAFLRTTCDPGNDFMYTADVKPIALAIPAGILSDFAVLTIGRRMIRWLARSSSFVAVCASLIAGILLIGVLIMWPMRVGIGAPFTVSYETGAVLVAIGASNIITAAAIGMYVAYALFLLVHQAAWPIIERPVYAAARHGILRRRRVVSAAAVVLLGIAHPGLSATLVDLFKRLAFW